MEEDKITDEELGLEMLKFFRNIFDIHNRPCTLLLDADEEGRLRLIAAGTDSVELKSFLDIKQSRNYLG